MSVRILEGIEYEGDVRRACLFDGVTGRAFGPVVDAGAWDSPSDRLDDFLAYCAELRADAREGWPVAWRLYLEVEAERHHAE